MAEHGANRSHDPDAARSVTAYDPETALVVVDVQNDFADPRGALYVPGGEEVVPVVNREIDRALEAGALVVCTQDWHPERTPHFQTDGGIWPVHCVAGTWGAQLHPLLRPVAGEPIRKGAGGEDGYSAFSVRDPTSGQTAPTRLERVLREGGIRRVVVVGLATDYCVAETALDARRLGFETLVPTEAVRAVNLEPGDGERALERMRAAGATLV
ncbi:MAG TPA: isochorismatase family protein [Actinomycetota bacterium]|nr:isochorismatase family protein [Actinomycetota bacterium]